MQKNCPAERPLKKRSYNTRKYRLFSLIISALIVKIYRANEFFKVNQNFISDYQQSSGCNVKRIAKLCLQKVFILTGMLIFAFNILNFEKQS